MNWNELSEKLMLDDFVVILLFILALRFLFRPRQPKVIYAHLNLMIKRVGLRPLTIMLLGTHVVSILTYSYNLFPQEGFISDIPIFAFLLFGGINTIYVLYWSQPFSRKRTGVKAVDEAVERYKKPNERAVGIIGGWCPDLVVDGKRYKLITYAPKGTNSLRGLLAFDETGSIVTDISQMEKIKACFQLAAQFANPENINERTSIYVNAMKTQKAWQTTFEDFEKFSQETMKKRDSMARHTSAVLPMLEAAQRMSKDMMSYFEQEARWGNQRGNTQIKSIAFEDAQEMNRLWKDTFGWLISELPQFQEGLEAGEKILKQLGKATEKTREMEAMRVFLAENLPRYKALSSVWADWKEKGEVRDRFYGKLDEDEMRFWQSRLEWVDKVDAKGRSK